MNTQKGFTLIEILVAMAIFALIAVGATQILTRVTDSNTLSDERFAQLRELQRAMVVIEQDFLQLVPRKVRENSEVSEFVIRGGVFEFASEADGIAFVRAGWHNPKLMLKRSTQQAVAYRLQAGQLQRVYSTYVDVTDATEPKVRVLLHNIKDFSVELLSDIDGSEQKWSKELNVVTLPYAVAIEIESEIYGKIRREFKVRL